MGSMKKMVLGAALAVGAMAFTAVPAEAAHIGVYFGVGAPGAYMPPSPGPGYAWVGGYWDDGAWVPGYWNYVGGYSPAYGYYGYGDGDGWRGGDDDGWRGGDDGGWRGGGEDFHGGWGRGRDWGHDRGGWGRGGEHFRR